MTKRVFSDPILGPVDGSWRYSAQFIIAFVSLLTIALGALGFLYTDFIWEESGGLAWVSSAALVLGGLWFLDRQKPLRP